LRFWNADGGGGYPGTFITGFDIGPLALPAGDSFLSFAPSNAMTVPAGRFWYGITFDNNTNTTGISAAELDNLGVDIYDPPVTGSSADEFFQTGSAGSFFGINSPSGSVGYFGGPSANFYFGMTAVSGNLPPVANPQSVSVKENHSLNITLTATEPEGEPLTYAIVNSPGNGTISGSPPNVVYTPKTNFFGSDSFTFKANDGHSDSAPALVSISVTSTNGLVINPIWDSSITSDPNVAIITNTIISAIQVFESRIADPVTVSILFVNTSSGLGENSTYINTISYSSFFSALTSHSNTTNDTLALAQLTGGPNEPVTGGSSITLPLPNLRALGFTANPGPGNPDSTISLNLSICNTNRISINPSKYDLMAVASHEIDEVLGTGSGLGTANINPPDLFRYSSTPGVRNYTTSGDNAYFSLDGTNDLARYNQNAGADYGDWWSASGDPHQPQVQDAYGTPGATPNLGVELTVLDVVGWNLASAVASAPAPLFTSIKHTNNTVTLTWSTVSGLNYQLLYKANLLQNTWSNLGSSFTASASTASFTDAIGTNRTRFYRAELLNPPSSPSPALNFAQVALPPPTLRTNVFRPSVLAPSGGSKQ
jgi:hypothetical protein